MVEKNIKIKKVEQFPAVGTGRGLNTIYAIIVLVSKKDAKSFSS